MSESRYMEIYECLKTNILKGHYGKGELLPSETRLTRQFSVARNTVRRAIGMLANEALVQPIHGKGVAVIYEQINSQQVFTLDGIETFGEIAKKTRMNIITRVMDFEEIICDETLSRKTGFNVGDELFYIERIRILDDLKLIFDINIYLKEAVPGLNKEIAERSIYEYLEKQLGMTITVSRRTITAERATEKDRFYLDLKDFDFLAVVSGQVFNSDGVMFEYTQSRHRPDHFCFTGNAIRSIHSKSKD